MSDWTTGMDFVQLGGICIMIALFLFKNYVSPYIRKKGENLATKQDIAEITDEIEKVRSVYSKHLEDISQQNRLILAQAKQKHELRVAALDRRLEAHQQAFTLWRRLLHKVHDEEIGKIVLECQEWWVKNCLYLDAESRPAFRDAYDAAFLHRDLVDGYRGIPEGSEKIIENFKVITDAGEQIVEAAELPSLGEKEYKPIDPPESVED